MFLLQLERSFRDDAKYTNENCLMIFMHQEENGTAALVHIKKNNHGLWRNNKQE
jgi:hypothetical protein